MNLQLKPQVTNKDHIQGSPNAPIELVEYGDYQCIHCGQAYQILKRIQQRLGPDLKFVFRNFPLTEVHPFAFPSALAAEAAGLQSKFWEMHDIIYENQGWLRDVDMIEYASKIGLNIPKFKNDFQSEICLSKVEDDFESGIRSGVNGTPTFFINGMKYDFNWQEEEKFIHFLKVTLIN